MLKFIENLYEVRILRKNICYAKNSVLYMKWAFPTENGGYNPTYTEKMNETILKEILTETQNYKTVLDSPDAKIAKKYSQYFAKPEKVIVYGLDAKTPFTTDETLTMKAVKTKDDLILWGQLASKIYPHHDTDFIYESFKTDLNKSYASYFIFYKDKVPVGTSQIIRGAGYSAVYWVGVLEAYRKHGLGKELTKKTLNYEIMHKRYNFLLTASKLGLKIYKKLGFKPLETFYEYKFKKTL